MPKSKIFLDCGYYVGKALEYYAPFIDESWEVYAFEPMPQKEIKESLARFPFPIKLIKAAVWTEDGTAQFSMGEREDAGRLSKVRTSSEHKTKVKTVDFSKFVAQLPEDSIIACSMDIEGAEFPVLNKMLQDKTIKRISLLDIEFHDRILKDIDEGDSSRLRRAIEGEGVLVKLKI